MSNPPYHYVGIDFGTSNSSFTVSNDEGRFEVLALGSGRDDRILSSSLTLEPDGRFKVGLPPGLDLPRVHSVKRLLLDGETSWSAEGVAYSTADLLAHFFKGFWERSREAFSRSRLPGDLDPQKVRTCTVGVPVRFGENERAYLLTALAQIGVPEDRIFFIDEPVAITWAYFHAHQRAKEVARRASGRNGTVEMPEGLGLVFDFGAGTLDLAVVDIGGSIQDDIPMVFRHASSDRHFSGEVVHKDYLPLGGDDLDHVVMYLIVDEGKKVGNPVCAELDPELFLDGGRVQRFRKEQPAIYLNLKLVAETAKIELSDTSTYTFTVPPLHRELDSVGIRNLTLTRDAFEAAAAEIWSRIGAKLDEVEEAVTKLGRRMDYVLMAGGSSLVPRVQNMLRDRYEERAYVLAEGWAQTAVSVGGALYGREDAGIAVADLVHAAYGIWSHSDSRAVPVIDENETYPVTRTKRFATTRPYQDTIEIIPMVRPSGEPNFQPLHRRGRSVYWRLRIHPDGRTKDFSRFTVEFTVDKSRLLRITAYDNLFGEEVLSETVEVEERVAPVPSSRPNRWDR